jgi:hypothetical protein
VVDFKKNAKITEDPKISLWLFKVDNETRFSPVIFLEEDMHISRVEGEMRADVERREAEPAGGLLHHHEPQLRGQVQTPENVKQLFRQIAMVKTDRKLIARVN